MQILSSRVVNNMNIKPRVLNFFSRNKRFIFPFIFILFYVLLYFLIDFSTQSLVAHDEGLYARRARLIASSDNWLSSPFPAPHHKTLGSYWFIALSIRLFGNNELALRLPSILASFLCLGTLYFIALEIANKKSALICLCSLSAMPLWIQYSRYASPDVPFVLCILLVIFFFLKSIKSSNCFNKYVYILFSGLFISTSFFIRSYMALVPLIGLSPFLFYQLSKKDIIFKFTLFNGILLGSIPTLLNLYFSYQKYGIAGITTLFDFAKKQAIGGFGINNFLLLPLNFVYLTFPIGLFILILFVFSKINYKVYYPLLIYLYPFISLVILLCMSTSYPHYYLFLLPSLSILFAINITSVSFRFSFSKNSVKYVLFLLTLSLGFIILFLILNYNDFVAEYSYKNNLVVYIISSFLLLSYISAIRFLIDKGKHSFNLISFFYSLVIPQYISISLLFNFGILGSPNLRTKLFLRDAKVSSIIKSNTICLFDVDSKIQTLLLYYLPSSKAVDNFNDITKYKYVITSNITELDFPNKKFEFRSIKKFDDQFLLVKISK